MIPQSFIQDLLNRVDIVDVVGRYVPLKKGGANLMGLCPFHNEKSPSFTVSPTKQFYHCFGCGAHGTAISFLIDYSGLGFIEAVKDLAQGVGMTLPDDDDRMLPAQRAEYQAKSLALTEAMTRASDFYRQQLRTAQPAIDYLKGRGLTGEVASRFSLGYAPDEWDGLRQVFSDYEASALVEAGLVIDKTDDNGAHRKRYDRFRNRIIFPIRNTKGQAIGFGGRVMDGGEPKYLNSPETPLFQKGNELYGLFEARQAIREAGYVLVTEGYMDVVALAQLGFPQAVATLGTACTPTHVQKLLRQTDRVIFSFDGDSAGRRAARRALDACLVHATDNKTIQFLFLPAEHDPDSYVREMGAEVFEAQIRNAMPFSRFLLNEVTGDNDLQTPEGRARVQFDAKPLLQALPVSSLRLQIVRSLAQLTQSSPEEIESLFGLVQPVSRARKAPPRGKRAAPMGLERQMIRLLVAHPLLTLDVSDAALAIIEQVAPEHADLLTQLVGIGRSMGEQANFAALVEHLREAGPDVEALILEIAAEPESDLEAARLELFGAIRQTSMKMLREEAEQLAAAGLGSEEARQRYRELTRQQEVLRRQAGVELG
ncbi:DNA primase [Herbaspirillum sp. RTI4]|uniref:DNA primase n=1 Tax=Herbaspirillum sp. RTI4 TaxID=3048640 RepID=UPI002AB4A974|nr:DNA primase [Herbaspirillum sp. RTI4]MDY7580039.1 DNA primase [Herbaspirillum sp. RTI4]MEA9982978.1 DNA primase [Herbaspirillum sp. RTI4]